MGSVGRIILIGIALYSSSVSVACSPLTAMLDTTFNAAGSFSGIPGTERICFNETDVLRFNGVATDADDNIYLGGKLGGFADGKFAALALSPTGAPLWPVVLVAFVSDSSDAANGIALDSSRCVYLGGDVRVFGTNRFGAAKLSSAGVPIWTSILPAFEQNSSDEARGIALDSFGCVYLGGSTDFGDRRFAAAKLSGTGALIWTSIVPAFALDSGDEAQGIALDSFGCVYLGGSTDFGSRRFAAAKLSGTGALIWTSIVPAFMQDSDDEAQGIALDASGCVYLGGSTDFADRRFAVAKLSGTGALIWTSVVPAFASGFNDDAQGVAVDNAGCVYLGGTVERGDNQFAAVKLNTQGKIVWTSIVPLFGDGGENAFALALDTEKGVILAGISSGTPTCGAVAKLIQPLPPSANPPFIQRLQEKYQDVCAHAD